MLYRQVFQPTLNILRTGYGFATKKKIMELTIRTPYQTICENFTGFSRLLFKDSTSATTIQNRTPPALHLLPPGQLKIKLTAEAKKMASEYIHTGGWVIVHNDNSVEVNLIEAVERAQIKADQVGKIESKPVDSPAAKYINRISNNVKRNVAKKLG